MSETIIPDVQQTSDVLETQETPVIEETTVPEQPAEETQNFAEKTLGELVDIFAKLQESVDKMKKSKEAEAIKSAFYKKLLKEKAEAGMSVSDSDPEAEDETAAETPETGESAAEDVKMNPFQAIESAFKDLYSAYKRESRVQQGAGEGARGQSCRQGGCNRGPQGPCREAGGCQRDIPGIP